jgi:hypothetical protein
MNLQHLRIYQVNDSKLMRPARGHVMARLDAANAFKINSVFLRNRNSSSGVNWQTELLKLEDAS